jgi:myo-inositol 2-dehydrogenase/D-chiro-inositol 1-dehydrogenase
MNPFRLGLIGAGRMGRTHMSALSTSTSVRIVAAAEAVETTRQSLVASNVDVYSDYEEMLRIADLDGVLIAVPSDQHLNVVSKVAGMGLPILCEKPCGISSEQARAAAAVARAHSVPLQVAYWRRFVPALQQLEERIRRGDLGSVYFVACYQWDEMPPPAAFRAHSGGIFVDMGVHEFDQMRWLTDQDVMHLYAVPSLATAESSIAGDAESAAALCNLNGGATALVSLGRRYAAGDMCKVEVFGTFGSADIQFLTPSDGTRAFFEALRFQAEGFASWIRGGPMIGATAEDAIAALEAAEHASLSLGGAS